MIFVVGLLDGMNWLDMFMTAVSLAVAAIPEGLPAIEMCIRDRAAGDPRAPLLSVALADLIKMSDPLRKKLPFGLERASVTQRDNAKGRRSRKGSPKRNIL